MVSKRVSVLVNAAAGGNRGLGRGKSLVAELADRGWTVDLLKATNAAEVSEAITDAADRGMTRLVLAGGDGLVHHALPALVGTDIIVGLVPIGTGNDFCRGLGLPGKRQAAIDSSVSDVASPVDVIAVRQADTTCFAATVVTAGFSGRVNSRANEMASKRGFPNGSSRYSLATVAEMASLEAATFTLTVDEDPPIRIEAPLVAVGNTRYFGGGMAVCPAADFTDGAMELITIDPVKTTTFMRVLPQVFSGRYVRHPAVCSRRCRTITIDTSEPLWADGEPLFAEVNQPAVTELSVVSRSLLVAGVE